MVRRHRKLFPTNGTECSDFCGDPYAEFYYLSPPPPSPPSSPLPLPLPPPGHNDGVLSNGVSPPVIVLFSLLFFFILLILYYVVVSKSCLGLCKRRRRREDDLTSSSSSRSDGGGDIENRAAAAAVDHPIWLIATVGLQQAIINSITAVRYRKDEGLIEGTDCTVCLSEFREDETVRLLPKCSHAFHVTCIDAWLRSHTNCPLCRACIVAATATTTTTTTESSTEGSGSASRGSLENSSGQNNRLMNVVVEEEEARSVENITEIESNDTNVGFEENDVARLVRRSVSMDHIKGSGLRRSYRFDQDFGGQKREDKFLKMVRLSPVAMKKRSLSCGGIRFFSSR